MKIGEANCLVVEFVQIGCFQDRVSMARQVSVSLIVSHDKDHVWPVLSDSTELAEVLSKGPVRFFYFSIRF